MISKALLENGDGLLKNWPTLLVNTKPSSKRLSVREDRQSG